MAQANAARLVAGTGTQLSRNEATLDSETAARRGGTERTRRTKIGTSSITDECKSAEANRTETKRGDDPDEAVEAIQATNDSEQSRVVSGMGTCELASDTKHVAPNYSENPPTGSTY